MSSTRGKTPQNPFTPTVLNQMLKKHLSEQFASFWLMGEIFEHYQSPAGHSYFTLKDQEAGIKCVMFKQKQSIALKKGMKVTLLGQMTVYTPKGDIQVNVVKVIESGQGDLAQQFLILKQKLMNAGLFEAARKRPIPTMVNSLGIITSKNGAALQDILNVLLHKNPLIEVTIYHTPVQGNEAPPQINHALRTADSNKHDLLLLTRGGGSKEDLWAFNDEFLAHQMAQLETPIISAVGHETDESISDLVADMHCITPTAAAQYICGDFNQLSQKLSHHSRLLSLLMQDKLRIHQQEVDSLSHRLDKSHPKNLVLSQQNSLASMQQNLTKTFNNLWQIKNNQIKHLADQLSSHKPNTKLESQKLSQLTERLNWKIKHALEMADQKLRLTANDLNNQSPLKVMSRGYSITTELDSGAVISDISQVKIGDQVSTQLKSGRIHAKIFERLED
ncbi:exodeoxyribonuclease VII large subunit [Marinicella litoralis]|uniref:Exodeoxyribonuclease 7 large subunit n=1 Tax=Marinicella litoralis TaxID=644220 RepID=A0A4V3DHI7_9GAMM|nr:exodeoxyribonuclease VII large subunit [Marinicella litoralis]TDR18381.1 exodeoxyribonuclease VII large subunit [Marinicella litoralis]